MKKRTIKEVFVAGGMPRVTYVEREKLGLEKRLRKTLSEGYQIICITGPTKSGKTVLCRKTLEGRDSVWIEGGKISSIDEFWQQAAEELEIEIIEKKNNTTKSSGGISYIVKVFSEDMESVDRKRFSSAKNAVINHCSKSDVCLVVDDFHYLDSKIRKKVIRSLKSAVFDGMDVILIAVPHRAFDAISAEREMEGRFSHIPIPPWAKGELLEICEKGFPALNIELSESCKKIFAEEAFKSPILMQRFCYHLCDSYDFSETLSENKKLNPSESKRNSIFKGVAENFGLPTFKRLSDGPQSRKDRLARKLRGSYEEVDIYEAILMAVAKLGPKDENKYNEIRESLRSLLNDSDVPQKNQITSCLKYMNRIAHEDIEGEPVLEWKDDVLYMTDSSLMFYMRWAYH